MPIAEVEVFESSKAVLKNPVFNVLGVSGRSCIMDLTLPCSIKASWYYDKGMMICETWYTNHII